MSASKKALAIAENAKDLRLNRFKMTKNGQIEEHMEPLPRVANRLGKSQDFGNMPGRLTSNGPLSKLKSPLKPVDIISNQKVSSYLASYNIAPRSNHKQYVITDFKHRAMRGASCHQEFKDGLSQNPTTLYSRKFGQFTADAERE